jgi:hypothetical protein
MYDIPATLKTFGQWHEEAGLIDVDVRYGFNGLEGRGTKAAVERSKVAALSRKLSIGSVIDIRKPIG